MSPEDEGPISRIAIRGSLRSPGRRHNDRFRAFENTLLPPPEGANPSSIQDDCKGDPGWNGRIFPSGERSRSAPFSNTLAGRTGTVGAISDSGATRTGETDLLESPGTVDTSPRKGSPVRAEPSTPPQETSACWRTCAFRRTWAGSSPHIWSLPRLQEVFPFPMDDRWSGRDSPLLSHPPLGTRRTSFLVPGSSRHEALDSTRAGCFPQALCFPRVPPKRVSSSFRVFAANFRVAKYRSHSE